MKIICNSVFLFQNRFDSSLRIVSPACGSESPVPVLSADIIAAGIDRHGMQRSEDIFGRMRVFEWSHYIEAVVIRIGSPADVVIGADHKDSLLNHVRVHRKIDFLRPVGSDFHGERLLHQNFLIGIRDGHTDTSSGSRRALKQKGAPEGFAFDQIVIGGGGNEIPFDGRRNEVRRTAPLFQLHPVHQNPGAVVCSVQEKAHSGGVGRERALIAFPFRRDLKRGFRLSRIAGDRTVFADEFSGARHACQSQRKRARFFRFRIKT